MKVILQEDIPSLGKTGDIVTVADGYGRNYLVPRNKAVKADTGSLKRLRHQQFLTEHKKRKLLKTTEELARRIEEFSCVIPVKMGEGDKIFGSVTAIAIAETLRKGGIPVDKKQILLEEPIRSLGVFPVDVRVLPTAPMKATLKVWVVKKEEE